MDNINGLRLRRLDLNSLVVLHTLLQTRSVSLSARQLCLGQPAISHVLKHLREQFADELLYRHGRGMALTPLAQSLSQPLAAWLGEGQRLFASQQAFDPSEAQGTVRLAMPDLLEAILLPGMLQAMQHQAPQLNLAIEAMPAAQVEGALEEGRISAAFGYFPRPGRQWQHLPLFKTSFIALYHPALISLPPTVGLADLVAMPHVHTSYVDEGSGLIEQVMTRRGLPRRVVVHGAGLLALPVLLETLAAVAVLPQTMAAWLRQHHPMLCQVPVLDPEMQIEIEMVWHTRLASDPLLGFVRGIVSQEVDRRFAGPLAD
ncbi:LysR family transcriptional regulator [Paludibacterium sp. B53371]|uniref:LysR family transcriptional regulator n=1 Tax=Paludibacterium sp. B53371 TaxID=2806263 RepID=UPI001C057654|nr:LysR family transcriptional regulator [Paludibacterium sp. B53371]